MKIKGKTATLDMSDWSRLQAGETIKFSKDKEVKSIKLSEETLKEVRNCTSDEDPDDLEQGMFDDEEEG